MTRTNERRYTSVEICAGAGGQAVGLHNAGFQHVALIEIDRDACQTLRANTDGNPEWDSCKVIEADLREFDPADLGLEPGELDLLAGGVPCPPFSAAGKQLGRDDERDLFPTMLELVDHLEPKAVMIENVRGLLDPKFAEYRQEIIKRLESMGYEECYWDVLEAKNYRVPQLRPRAILVAMKPEYAQYFEHSKPEESEPISVGEALHDSMRARYEAVASDPRAEKAFKDWYKKALADVAPTVVGGSKKHGGADLGPTRAKRAWAELGVCGLGVANEPEEMKDAERDLFAPAGPKLTVAQAAIIQGFPSEWKFSGRKTAAYRQVGNAFPPPVAQAVGEQIYAAFEAAAKTQTG
ncbi:DNA cytosine methyltransferase [Streptomyces himalayensis]|uniref:Cytosine-specific methyltransferase n=1 Tax=Streptomyces himalayensis subsp. himalayensis TaxID=2756131 RepID=A0A7W0IBN9_9ACTN|nr:DNA cytosine methyltransferase [Streptomyces himalayensis]MBA2949730.1 DNA cytosine methyltransferase [Streptomyces himalayensis subsp. himalayensis]